MNLAAIPSANLKRLALVLCLLLVLLILALSAYYWKRLNSAMDIMAEFSLDVPAGSAFSQVSFDLHNKGYLSSPVALNLWARFSGLASQVKAGEYEFSRGTTPIELLDKLVRGDVKQYQVTLLEGWTAREALQEIWSAKGVAPTLAMMSEEEIAATLNIGQPQLEGLLFPDTYFYTSGTTDADILNRAQQRLQAVLNQAWEHRLDSLPYATPYEALIMASIIEKESSVGSERGHIAGVFIKRLEMGMRLQSDPTIIYGLANRYEGNITREFLEEVTPYNTYRIDGLPPTPIALAGKDSILASLNPIPSDFLYFVAKGDGSHYFSSTLEQHNAAVRQYQLGATDQVIQQENNGL